MVFGMRMLTRDEFQGFLLAKPVAVVHFDAGWDVGYRPFMRREMLEAERKFGTQVSFAEVDCDAELELSKSIPISNVPLVAYYRDGQLVARLIGRQDVAARVERVLRGEPIGYQDGTGRG
jgi:thioredoxin-like negative regulator of GroEL